MSVVGTTAVTAPPQPGHVPRSPEIVARRRVWLVYATNKALPSHVLVLCGPSRSQAVERPEGRRRYLTSAVLEVMDLWGGSAANRLP